MPIPVIVAKLVAAAPKIVAFASTVAPFVAKNKKDRLAQNSTNMADLKSKIDAQILALGDKQAYQQNQILSQKMPNSDEQIIDTTTSSEKAFLGLQTVEAGKKQQTKIIMIAGGILLLLFFFMKKK